MNTDVRTALAVLRHGLELLEQQLDQAEPNEPPPPVPAVEEPAPRRHLAPYLHGGEVVNLTFDEHRLLDALETLADKDAIYRGGRRALEQNARMGHEVVNDTLAALAKPDGDRQPMIRRVPGPRGRQDFDVLTLHQ